MATAFRRKKNRLVARLEEQELLLLVHVLRLTRDFVAPEQQATGDPVRDLLAGLGDWQRTPAEPDDPALLRLLPPASTDDPEQAAEFRRLTEHSLRSRKTATLSTAIAALEKLSPGKISLDLDQAQALAIGLTDTRLILGERLGLRTDEDADRIHAQMQELLEQAQRQGGPDEPEMPRQFYDLAYYDFLSWVQESITLALLE